MASDYILKFTDKASEDLDEILGYISNTLDNKAAAKNFLDNVDYAIERICAFPELGKVVHNEFLTRDDVRQVVIGNYILYYLPSTADKTIIILSIIYGKRNLNDILSDFNS